MSSEQEPFDAFVRRVTPEHAVLILFEYERLRDALEWINAEPEDPLKVQQRALEALGRGGKNAG